MKLLEKARLDAFKEQEEEHQRAPKENEKKGLSEQQSSLELKELAEERKKKAKIELKGIELEVELHKISEK